MSIFKKPRVSVYLYSQRTNLLVDKKNGQLILNYYVNIGDLVVEGKIIQRADIQPVNSSIYMSLKKLVKGVF